MRAFFQDLPNQPLPVRRRFVVLATAGSFALVVLVWVVLSSVGGPPAADHPSVPSPGAAGTGGGGVETPVPAGVVRTPTPAPTSASPVDVGEVSTDLLRALRGGAR